MRWALALLLILLAAPARGDAAENRSETLYRERCAQCHEAGVARAPDRAALGQMPAETIRQEVASQTLASVKLDDGDHHRPLAVIYKKNKVLSPGIKQFIAVLKEAA